MLARDASVGALELRRRPLDDDEEFEDDGFSFDDEDEDEDFDDEDEDFDDEDEDFEEEDSGLEDLGWEEDGEEKPRRGRKGRGEEEA